MGNVNLNPIENKGTRNSEEYLRYIAESLAMLQDELQNILEGRISAENIKANTITAEKINVNELSAISANLGTITAGLLSAVTIIGSLIQTASPGVYPRIELSSSDNLLKAFASATKTMSILATWLGFPTFRLEDGLTNVDFYLYKDLSTSYASLESSTGIRFYSNTGDIDLVNGSGRTRVDAWNSFLNRSSGRSLQQDLDAKQNTISGYTGSFSTGTQTVTVANGIITSVV